MNVRVARGAELEQSFPFGVVRQLFDPLLAACGDAERGEWLAGAAELAAPLFDARALEHEPSGQDSIYPRLHGLYWLCSNLARKQPLALCLDDAHWADEPSLAFFGFLARRLEELPILLVVAARPVAAEAPEELGPLLGDPRARRLTPQGLSSNAVEHILGAEIGAGVEPEFARACRDATAGNPFLHGRDDMADYANNGRRTFRARSGWTGVWISRIRSGVGSSMPASSAASSAAAASPTTTWWSCTATATTGSPPTDTGT
jgi:hypothetical protein